MINLRIRAVALVCMACLTLTAIAESGVGVNRGDRALWAVSPVFGWDRNELKVHGPGGAVTTQTDTAPEYGLFLLMAHPNLVINDFLFWTDVNDTDVFGNLAFLNVYGPREDALTWNVGAGHLYHKIKPANEEITVTVPMVKAGPLFRLDRWHLRVNPYVGYAWERIDTQHGDQDNDSYLYGISASWRWRMLAASVKYYYQDSREASEDYQTLRARINAGFSDHWGGVVRFDYMEHSTTDDTSIMLGPTYVF